MLELTESQEGKMAALAALGIARLQTNKFSKEQQQQQINFSYVFKVYVTM